MNTLNNLNDNKENLYYDQTKTNIPPTREEIDALRTLVTTYLAHPGTFENTDWKVVELVKRAMPVLSKYD